MIVRALTQDTPIILLDEPTSFLDLPNRYELGILLQKLAHKQKQMYPFSTHELDIALTLCDSIALIDHPHLHYLPTRQMINSGHIERLFRNRDYHVRSERIAHSYTMKGLETVGVKPVIYCR